MSLKSLYLLNENIKNEVLPIYEREGQQSRKIVKMHNTSLLSYQW